MKHRSIILLLLLFYRVFVIPVGFSLHIDELKSTTDSFEQVRLKKRRSSYLEDGGYIFDAIALTSAVAALSRKRFPLRFKKSISALFIEPFSSFLVHSHSRTILCCHYLRNRALRI